MYCPEHLVLKLFNSRLHLWLIYRDVPRETIPLKVWLNPLRYELNLRMFGKAFVITRWGIRSERIGA